MLVFEWIKFGFLSGLDCFLVWFAILCVCDPLHYVYFVIFVVVIFGIARVLYALAGEKF